MDNSRALFPTLGYAPTASDACQGADVVLVLTEWSEFCKLQPADLDAVVRHKVLIDGRNCLDPQQWRRAGWTYHGLGRP